MPCSVVVETQRLAALPSSVLEGRPLPQSTEMDLSRILIVCNNMCDRLAMKYTLTTELKLPPGTFEFVMSPF